jgi:hypothetical protein
MKAHFRTQASVLIVFVIPLCASLLFGCSASRITSPRYSLCYGISNYQDTSDLASPSFDAHTMRDLLVSSGYTERATRVDSVVTKNSIKNDIIGLSELEPGSIVVIFYSSHGTYDYTTGISYLVPYDAINEIGVMNMSLLISPSELQSWISQSGQRNVIAIVHTCYSGGFVDPQSSKDISPQNYGPNDGGTTPGAIQAALCDFGELLAKNATQNGEPGPIVISAAGSKESAWESTSSYFGGHAVFTCFLFQAATKGDGDGYVTAVEAYSYTAAAIRLIWNTAVQDIYNAEAGVHPDFMPHISGGARDLVLFDRK